MAESQQSGTWHGRGRRNPESKDVRISKTLSSVLRHNAEKFGFQLMKGGFLYVDELLTEVQGLKGVTVDDIKRVVDTNNKKRFTLEMEGERLKIKANQGHSLEVDSLELAPVLSAEDLPVVIHGTYFSAWEKIHRMGLSRMGRNHIHFAAGEPGEEGVISGMRTTCEVMIYLDLEKALKDGLQFFRSANNVILSPGDKDGFIAPCYFQAVVDRRKKHKIPFDSTICTPLVMNTVPDDEIRNKKQRKKDRKKQYGEVFIENETKDHESDTKSTKAGAHVAAESSVVWNSDFRIISSSQDSSDFIDHIFSNSPSFVVTCCAGQKLATVDSCLEYIIVLARPEICVYHITDKTKVSVADGCLDQLFLSKDIHKVFCDIRAASLSLVNEYSILLDGTAVWDIQLLFNKVQLSKVEQEEIQERHSISNLKAVFKKWMKEDVDIAKKLGSSELDQAIVEELVNRGKVIWDLFDVCHRKLSGAALKSLKAEIFKAAFSTNDDKLSEKIGQLKLETRQKSKSDKKHTKKSDME